MGWAWAYLAVSVVGAALVVNAYRPLRSGPVSVFSFFSGWLTGELPVHNIVWQAMATVLFGFLGAFDSWPGWVGLGITAAAWIGLVGLHRSGASAGEVIHEALAGARDEVVDRVLYETMWTARRRVMPVALRTKTFEVFRNIDYAGTASRLTGSTS